MDEFVPGRYVWRIESLSLCPVGGCIKSPIYNTGHVEWQVRFFPLALYRSYWQYYYRIDWEGKTNRVEKEVTVQICIYLDGEAGNRCILSVTEKRQISDMSFSRDFLKIETSFLEECLEGDVLTCRIEVGFYYCVSRPLELNIPSNLESLRADLTEYLLKQPTDVTLRSDDGGQGFSAHRHLLSARSEVFQKMLTVDMLENRSGDVRLPNLTSPELQELVHFLYGREVNPVHLNTSLYSAAHKYGLPNLQRLCSRELVSRLRVDAVCAVAALASLHSDTELLSAVQAFFADNAAAVVVSSSYVELLKQSPDVARQLVANVSKAGESEPEVTLWPDVCGIQASPARKESSD